MIYSIPEIKDIEINTIVLDLNGTLSVNGVIPEDVKEALKELKDRGFRILLFTGDQRGTAANLCADLGINFVKCRNAYEKEQAFHDKCSLEKTAAIGNARIDIGTFKQAKISIATLQAEGIHAGIIEHVDVIVPTVLDALNFFLDEHTLCATMRI